MLLFACVLREWIPANAHTTPLLPVACASVMTVPAPTALEGASGVLIERRLLKLLRPLLKLPPPDAPLLPLLLFVCAKGG